MYEQTLSQAGLTKDQAEIYEILIKNGSQKAGKISQKSNLKRGLVYKLLDQLTEIGLIEKKEEEGKAAVFTAAHPLKLKELAEKREQQAKDAQLVLSGVLPSIISDFNLISGRPGVQVYEGLEGIKKVIEDSLVNAQKQILTFSDVAGYATYLKDWNTNYYAPKRKKLGIKEKVIIPNNEKALEYMKGYKSNEVTEIIFIDHKLYPFATEINIYENKVSFVTFSEVGHIGVIIENKEIFNTLTAIFNFAWETGKKYCADLQPGWTKPVKSSKPPRAGAYEIPPEIQ